MEICSAAALIEGTLKEREDDKRIRLAQFSLKIKSRGLKMCKVYEHLNFVFINFFSLNFPPSEYFAAFNSSNGFIKLNE